ncbi:MAG: hypothetical protein Q7U88_00260 [Desulfocapsaceae bacterium]|nr:hypothetical protein [Desulfocapsaceae bacterium]
MFSRKYHLMILSLLFTVVVVNAGYAQDKVVVVPLNSSKPAVAAWDGGNQNLTLSVTDKIVRTITLNLPSKGLVIVNASGYCDFYDTSDVTSYCRCSISQGSVVDYNNLMISGTSTSAKPTSDYMPWGATRAFPLDAGTQTFNLVCNASDNLIIIGDTQINAVFHSMPDIIVPTASASLDVKDAAGCVDNYDPTKCN